MKRLVIILILLYCCIVAVPSVLAQTNTGGATCLRYTFGLAPPFRSTLSPRPTGNGYANLDTVNNTLTYSFRFSNLSGPATAAHIHGFVTRGNAGGILSPITVPAATTTNGAFIGGVWNYQESQEANIIEGLSYINIHTSLNPSGEISGWIDGGIPCLPPGVTNLPLCPTHDKTKWHGLIDPVRNCHYDHEHKDNPNYLDNLFGVPGSWWGTSQYPAQEISYPFQTYRVNSDGSQTMENDFKHWGYSWGVRKNMECMVGNQPGCLTDFRIQFHNLANVHDAVARHHSFSVEARACMPDPSNPSQKRCGIVKEGGWMDFGRLKSDEQLPSEIDHIPLVGDPDFSCNGGTIGGGRRIHKSIQVNQHDATWYASNNSGCVSTNRHRTTPAVIFESWSPIDLTNYSLTTPNTPTNSSVYNELDYCTREGHPKSMCQWNGSVMEPHIVNISIPTTWDGAATDLDGASNGLVTMDTFTDRYGNLVQNCSKASLGVDCVPLIIQSMPVGNYEYREDENGMRAREYDVSPAGYEVQKRTNNPTIINDPNSWWIQYPVVAHYMGGTTPMPTSQISPSAIPTTIPSQQPTIVTPTSIQIGNGEVNGTPPVDAADVKSLFSSANWYSNVSGQFDQYKEGFLNMLDVGVVMSNIKSPTPTAIPTTVPTSAPTSTPQPNSTVTPTSAPTQTTMPTSPLPSATPPGTAGLGPQVDLSDTDNVVNKFIKDQVKQTGDKSIIAAGAWWGPIGNANENQLWEVRKNISLFPYVVNYGQDITYTFACLLPGSQLTGGSSKNSLGAVSMNTQFNSGGLGTPQGGMNANQGQTVNAFHSFVAPVTTAYASGQSYEVRSGCGAAQSLDNPFNVAGSVPIKGDVQAVNINTLAYVDHTTTLSFQHNLPKPTTTFLDSHGWYTGIEYAQIAVYNPETFAGKTVSGVVPIKTVAFGRNTFSPIHHHGLKIEENDEDYWVTTYQNAPDQMSLYTQVVNGVTVPMVEDARLPIVTFNLDTIKLTDGWHIVSAHMHVIDQRDIIGRKHMQLADELKMPICVNNKNSGLCP